jgi:hypothetical protein
MVENVSYFFLLFSIALVIEFLPRLFFKLNILTKFMLVVTNQIIFSLPWF